MNDISVGIMDECYIILLMNNELFGWMNEWMNDECYVVIEGIRDDCYIIFLIHVWVNEWMYWWITLSNDEWVPECIMDESYIILLVFLGTFNHVLPLTPGYSDSFSLMSSWIALRWHSGMKTTFKTKYMKIKCIRIFTMDI